MYKELMSHCPNVLQTRKTVANIMILVKDRDEYGPEFVQVPNGIVKVPENIKMHSDIFHGNSRLVFIPNMLW